MTLGDKENFQSVKTHTVQLYSKLVQFLFNLDLVHGNAESSLTPSAIIGEVNRSGYQRGHLPPRKEGRARHLPPRDVEMSSWRHPCRIHFAKTGKQSRMLSQLRYVGKDSFLPATE